MGSALGFLPSALRRGFRGALLVRRHEADQQLDRRPRRDGLQRLRLTFEPAHSSGSASYGDGLLTLGLNDDLYAPISGAPLDRSVVRHGLVGPFALFHDEGL